MKKFATLGSILTLAGTLGWADTTPPAPPPSGANTGAAQPCKQIEQACTGAGFVKGEAAQGKGLFKDCMRPIMKGQAVNGVSVDPTVVSACKEKMAKRRARRQGGQGNPGGGNANGAPPANSGSGSQPSGGSGNSSDQ